MNDTGNSFLGGRVLIRHLPAFDSPQGSEGLSLKRLLLSKGELAQFHNSDLPIRYIAWLELRSGRPRGNHYHNAKQEHVYLVSGSLILRAQGLTDSEQVTIRLNAGALVRIEPGVAHVLEPLEDGQAVEFSPAEFDFQDTYPFQLSQL